MSEQERIQEAGAAFTRDTADHQMTVLRDDGLYRHLRFQRMAVQEDGSRKPTSFYWFDIVTWPGILVINGGMGSFTFTRVTDMFEFFRGHQPNPGYWAEKLNAHSPLRVYSEEAFREHVIDDLRDAVERGDAERGLGKAIRLEVLEAEENGYEDGARRAAAAFEHATVTYDIKCSCGERADGLSRDDAYGWRTQHMLTSGHRPGFPLRVGGFRFEDSWEWDLTDYTHQFLWCCHAVPWAIGVYDAAKKAAAGASEAVPA